MGIAEAREALRLKRLARWDGVRLQIRKLYFHDGLSYSETAKRVGCSVTSLQRCFARWGWKARRSGGRKGVPQNLSEEGARRQQIHNKMRSQFATSWWESRRECIVDMLWRGESVKDTAMSLGKNEATLRYWLPRLGVHRVWYDERDDAKSLSRQEAFSRSDWEVDE